MGSTEASPAGGGARETSLLRELRLREAHIEGCCALVTEARWNQTAQDWRSMLALGEGYGLAEPGGRLVATSLALPYPSGGFGWISMVLVSEDWRRKGLATRLMGQAMEALARANMVAVLDATPAGREVYRQLGFEDTWGILRMQRSAPAALPAVLPAVLPAAPGVHVREMTDADLDSVLALDREAFAADRAALLEALRLRLPAAALVAERGGQVCGFLLGRDGRIATQLGPCVAADEAGAIALLAAGLGRVQGPVFLDVPDVHAALSQWLRDAGFELQRPYTRMILGRSKPFNAVERLFAIAGPELG